ncbi:MAG: DMT family transporter [Treponema sp.]|nr:DMT family transporter [Treponema sp.]
MNKRHKALAAIITCVFFWGFSFISTKIAVAVFPPLTLGAIRFAIAVIFLFFLKRKYAPNEKPQKSDIILLAGAGLAGVTLYFACENQGVMLIPASEASLITAAIPILILISERIQEKITSVRKKRLNNETTVSEETAEDKKNYLVFKIILPAAGALISLTGVALVAGVSLSLTGAATGYLFMMGACFSWVTYCILTRPLFSRHSRIFIVFWQTLTGFLGFLPFAFFEISGQVQNILIPGFNVWGHILFLGICCSALGYSFYAQALEVLGAGTASLFLNFVPVISAIGGFFILGERLLPLQLFGAFLVLAGVYLAMSIPEIKRIIQSRIKGKA